MRRTAPAYLTRRQAMTALGAGALVLRTGATALSTSASTVSLATGVVFADEHGDGVRRASVRGLAGVLVSNGRDGVLTDRDGRWALPVACGESVFVVEPSGWTCARARASSYLHCPDGTPAEAGLRYAGVDATGALPASIDFGLVRAVQPRVFEALLFADTQAANVEELDYVRRLVLASTAETNAALALSHGDVMGDDLSLLPDYLDITRQSGIRWHHCPGNHDMNLDAVDPAFAFESWKRHVGPTHYAFQHGRATFILLNNIEYFGAGRAGTSGRGYRGRIGPAQLRFVETVLRHTPEDHLIVISMHIPLTSFDAPHSAADTTVDCAELLRLLAKRPHSVSFAGHSHTTEHHYLDAAHGFAGAGRHHHHVLTAASGSWWSGPKDANGIPVADSRDGSPKGYHVLSVDGHRYTTRFVPFDATIDATLRAVIVDGAGNEAGRRLLVVNVFDGGPNTDVSCELGGGLTLALTRKAMADPHVSDLFARHRKVCKPWVEAAPSSHVWMVELPAGAVEERAKLRVGDEMGRRFTRVIALGATQSNGIAASPISAG